MHQTLRNFYKLLRKQEQAKLFVLILSYILCRLRINVRAFTIYIMSVKLDSFNTKQMYN